MDEPLDQLPSYVVEKGKGVCVPDSRVHSVVTKLH